MINFVVLENDDNNVNKISDAIFNYMVKKKREFDILIYKKDSKDFCSYVRSNDANSIFIIDLEINFKFSCIDIIKYIRKYDWSSPIIVLTSNHVSLDKFKRLQVLDVVVKNINFEKNLFDDFIICFKQLKIKDSFRYRIGKVYYSIDYDKILYFYKDTFERKSVLVTENREYKIPLNLVKIKEILPDNFITTYKSCIVNSSRVDAFVWNEGKIVFDNSLEIFLLSKTHRDDIKNIYNK